ncbi:transglycosylase SLT domain-containing protein [Streptacidiphilus rugosus]|uniref:transglycosylase SLT domain-containing protein n=1 Tax=Streptacidiphilus rugosus TaxID=405783 RepID=UPI0018DC8464|nr:transglycosylase SLT domain-containing protein [Streptacidiphilus rugosus]
MPLGSGRTKEKTTAVTTARDFSRRRRRRLERRCAVAAFYLFFAVPISTAAQAFAATIIPSPAVPRTVSVELSHAGVKHPPTSRPSIKQPTRKATHTRSPAAHAVVAYPDDLHGWIAHASAILARHGDSVPPAAAVEARAMTESSGNPLAENHWDANQALYGGTYGLMQLIPPTFAEWCLPGHKNILNPVDSIIASVRYANSRYGSFTVIAYGKQGY